MENRTLTTILAATSLLAVLALVAVGAMGLARPAAAQTGVAGLPQITVVGIGEVKVVPDMASIQIGVETTAPTTQEALAQNSAQAQAIIDQIKQLGVAEADIQTSGLNIYPTYDSEGRNVTGYTVSNSVSVTIRNLQTAGPILDGVVQAGANRVYGISFGVSDMAAAQAQARDAALADARARAEQLAQGSGVSLGRVLFISESIGASPIAPVAMMDRAVGAGAPVPVQAGQQVIGASLQITFELR